MADFKIPNKGPLLEGSTKDIAYWLKRKQEDLASGKTEAKYANHEGGWIAAAQAELQARKAGKPEPKAPPGGGGGGGNAIRPASTALAKTAPPADVLAVQGSYRDAKDLTDKLAWLQQVANLVTPTTSCGRLPEGCAIALSVVHIDTRDAREGGETYGTGGAGRGILKSALLRIGSAAGISFDSDRCRRLDDGSDPDFCRYQAVGTVTGFDGREYELPPKTIELDLRDGSSQVEAMRARKKDGDIDTQLREMRMMILRHAEGRAVAGLIRNLGLKTSLTQEELQKPFVVAKLMFTGDSDDPAIRGRFADLIAAKMLGGKSALYSTLASGPATRADQGHAPQIPPPESAAQPWSKQIVDAPLSESGHLPFPGGGGGPPDEEEREPGADEDLL